MVALSMAEEMKVRLVAQRRVAQPQAANLMLPRPLLVGCGGLFPSRCLSAC